MNVNTVVKRILTGLLSLLLIFYVGYQGYRAIYNPFRTTRATSGVYQDSISADAFIIRNETPIEYNGGGVLDYVKQDGEAVSKGGEVAAVFSNEQSAENSRKLKALNKQLETYKELSDQKTVTNTDLGVINSAVKTSFLNLCQASEDNDVEKISKSKTEILELLNKKQLATGEKVDYAPLIDDINTKISKLSSTEKQSSSIAAPESGYFVSKTDGFETGFDYSKISSITPKEVESLFKLKPNKKENEIGKIINSYESYIVLKLSPDDAFKLKEGQQRTIHFLYSSVPELKATVVSINKDSTGVSAVLKATVMSSSFSLTRNQKIEIVCDTKKGIKVSNNLIHIVDNQKGVFVRNGNLINFKKIEPAFSEQGYTVADIIDNDESYLQVYDEIIINGDDLYDGKTIK